MNIPNWTGRSMPVYLGGLLKWLARLVANRRVSLALVAAVVIVDTGTSTRLSRKNYPKEAEQEVTPCAYL
jgi:hypothetical protein